MKSNFVVFFCLLFLSLHSYAQKEYHYKKPAELSDGWKTDNLQSQNIDSTLIYKMFDKLINDKNKIHSILLIKGDKLIVEEYLNGNSRNTKHDLRSATKSFISILMGIAIDKGFVESIDDPILKYIKRPIPTKNLDSRKEQITIRHLLNMSTGFDCNDWDKKSLGQEDRVYRKRNWIQYTLDLPMVRDPGQASFYCTMGVTLAAEIISQASGMSIDKFAKKYLFEPLGITNFNWGHTSLRKNIIASGKRLYMTSRDMAKFGKLIMNNGKWNSNQIVSEQWIKSSTTVQVKIGNSDYGFLWWHIPFKTKDKMINSIAAMGNGGQYIFIFKELDMIVVFTGGAYNSIDDKIPFAAIQNIILPSLTLD